MKNAIQPRLFPAQNDGALLSLRELSSRVGNNPLLVQASNGNTSIKLDGTLWIKASGKWLAHAMSEEMFVPIELAEVQESIREEKEFAPRRARKDDLLPSIETAMHAVLRHRVVVHVHSINAIAWAIREDGPGQLMRRLAGLPWQWVPYAESGFQLAREIEMAVGRTPETSILVLGNHGLVVCGPDCSTAETLLGEVEKRLAIIPRPVPKPNTRLLGLIAHSSRWQIPDVDLLHALGTDAVSRRILRGGVLYPCQAIFLGQTMPVVSPSVVVSKYSERQEVGDKIPPFVAVERSGVMLNAKMTGSERATLIGLVQVTQRTEQSARLRYLKSAEVSNVLNKGAHGAINPIELTSVRN
jgi:rhamnose utilization protein RhaD (predicted bifunctional aldolase and dehydrogenase)